MIQLLVKAGVAGQDLRTADHDLDQLRVPRFDPSSTGFERGFTLDLLKRGDQGVYGGFGGSMALAPEHVFQMAMMGASHARISDIGPP